MTGPIEAPSSRPWHAVVVLLLVGLLAYCNSLTKGFVFDDFLWITDNPALADVGAFSRSAWAYSRPVVSWSLLLNYQLGGLSPVGYHLFNLAVHLLAGVVLFAIVRRTLLVQWPEGADDAAFAAALLWLVHPLQTQSVTYIIQRCESLMGLFFLLSVYCAVRGLSSARPLWWHLGAVLSALASELAKEVAPAIPLVVLAYDWVFVPGPFWPTFGRRWGLYAGLFVATWGALLGPGLLPSSGGEAASNAGFDFKGITPVEYLFTQPGVILHYLRLAVWPTGQALDYIDWPLARTPAEWLAPGLVIVAMLAFTFWALWRRWWPGFLGAWFFFILGPTSSVVPIADVAYEHRMYLPLAALTAGAAVAGLWLLGRRRGAYCLLALAAALAALTLARNEDYRTAESLLADNVRKRPGNKRALVNYALQVGAREGPAAQAALLADAFPAGAEVSVGGAARGQMHLKLGQFGKAAGLLRRWVESATGHPDSLAVGWNLLGQALLLRPGPDLPGAEKAFREAARLNPWLAEYRLYLAYALAANGKGQEADEQLAEALRLSPEVGAGLERAARLAALSKPPEDKGQRRYRRARAIFNARLACFATREAEAGPLDTLAIALAADGRFDEAARAARQALALAEKTGDARGAASIRRRLRLFEAKKPYNRETARGLAGKKP